MKRQAILTFLSLVVSISIHAQSQFRFHAKFVCGKATDEVIKSFATAPGVYFTSINVTNQNLQSTVKGQKRFSVGLLRQKVGPNTKFSDWALKPNETMQVDCSDIYERLGISPGEFIEGFVYIVGNRVRFDVAAVYTVSDGERVVSIDVEHLTPR